MGSVQQTRFEAAADLLKRDVGYDLRIMTVQLPDAHSRWRCGHCGNLTRFDVVRARTASEYWHFTIGGEPEIEEVEVTNEDLQQVSCRWCGASDRIEIVPRHGLEESPNEVGGP